MPVKVRRHLGHLRWLMALRLAGTVGLSGAAGFGGVERIADVQEVELGSEQADAAGVVGVLGPPPLIEPVLPRQLGDPLLDQRQLGGEALVGRAAGPAPVGLGGGDGSVLVLELPAGTALL